MTQATVTGKQMQSTVVMFILSTTLILGVNNQANQDSWISILIAIVMILPIFFVYTKILLLYPGKNLFDIIVEVFGKIFGKIICLVYVLYSLHLGSIVLRDNTEFIHIVNMLDTPQPLILSFMILLSILAVGIGMTSVSRIAKFTFPLVAGFIIVTSIMDYDKLNFSNILPVFNTDFKILLQSSFSFFSFPFGEAVLCMALFSIANPKDNPKKIYFKALAISSVLLLLSSFRNLLILGTPTANMIYFPSYAAASIVSVGEFFSRVEVVISANLLLATFIKANVCLFASSMGLAKIFNLEDYRQMVAPCGLIMATFSIITFSNMTEVFNFIKVYPIYAFPFQVILPIMILVGALIKTRKKSPKAKFPKPITANQNADPT